MRSLRTFRRDMPRPAVSLFPPLFGRYPDIPQLFGRPARPVAGVIARFQRGSFRWPEAVQLPVWEAAPIPQRLALAPSAETPGRAQFHLRGRSVLVGAGRHRWMMPPVRKTGPRLRAFPAPVAQWPVPGLSASGASQFAKGRNGQLAYLTVPILSLPCALLCDEMLFPDR